MKMCLLESFFKCPLISKLFSLQLSVHFNDIKAAIYYIKYMWYILVILVKQSDMR